MGQGGHLQCVIEHVHRGITDVMRVTDRFVLALTLLLCAVGTAHAGITGTISGRVVNALQSPVVGAVIVVEGGTGNSVTDENGTYSILGIVAGGVSLRVARLGFDTVVKKLALHADESRTIDIVLTAAVGRTSQTVNLDDDAEMVNPLVGGTEHNLDDNVLRGMARTNVGRALELLPSLSLSGNGISSRNSRPIETQVRVDGLSINDPIMGGLGSGGATLSPSMPSPFALRSVNIKSGGYGAEYGGANSAIINTIVNTGSTEELSGLVNWRTDVPALFGNAGNGIQAGAPKEDVVDAWVGGPLGFNNATFSLSIRNTYQNHRDYGLQVIDPWGNNLGELPNNRTWSRNFLGRVKLELVPNVSLLVGGMLGTVHAERSAWDWLYATEQVNGVAERTAKQAVVQDFATNVFAQLTHILNSNTMYDVRFAYGRNESETGKRKSFGAPNLLSGFDLWFPEDVLKLKDSSTVDTMGTWYVAGSNKVLDPYDVGRVMGYTEDGYVRLEVPTRNPLTGFYEGRADRSSTNNPYGLTDYFASGGNEGGIDFYNAQYMQIDGNVTHKIEGESIRQTFRAGFEARMYRLSRHTNATPWLPDPFYDVYGSDYGGNLYIDVTNSTSAAAKLASEAPLRPVTASAYVQDQILLEGFIITPGVRVDYLDVGAQATPKFYVSPRIAFAYPLNVSGRQILSVAAGVYHQAPPLGVDNPNSEMERTNQYQAAYHHQLNEAMAFSVTGYYRDVYNQSSLQFISILPTPYYQRTFSTYSTSRGIEFTFEKRVVDNWGVNLNYTLSAATRSAYDRTHRINAMVMLGWGAGEGPMIDGVPFLEHFAINLTGYWQTGLPYSRSITSGPNRGVTEHRYPSNWNTDLRVMRTFPLDGLMGAGTALDVYFDATNVLNITDALLVYSRTGDADYDGSALNRVMGDFPSRTYYKTTDPSNKATISPLQFDDVGKRKYNASVDVNADGKVTPEESYKGYLAYVDTVVARRLNYQYPRQVYFGVTFRF